MAYDDIFLSESDEYILGECSSGSIITVHPVAARHLLDLEFIAQYALSDSKYEYVITNSGLLYYAYLVKTRHENEKLKKKSRFEFTISLILSIAALVLSFISLIKQ